MHPQDNLRGLRALGYERFEPAKEETAGGKQVIEEANKVLGLL